MEREEKMQTTTDHSTIRDWAGRFQGLPVQLKTADKSGNIILAIIFDEKSGDQSQFVPWEKWLNVFEEQKLAFQYLQSEPVYKLVKREDQTDIHLQSPGEANRDKHINFVKLEQEGE